MWSYITHNSIYLFKRNPKICKLLNNRIFLRFKSVISHHGHGPVAVSPVPVALYLTDVINNAFIYHLMYNAKYGLTWAHEINGLTDSTIRKRLKELRQNRQTERIQLLQTFEYIDLSVKWFDYDATLVSFNTMNLVHCFLDIEIQRSFLFYN